MKADQYKAPLHLRSAHLQTILNGQGPRAWRARRLQQRMQTQTLVLDAEDGTRLVAELDHSELPGRSGLVILIHGWEGSSRSSYMVTTTRHLMAQGYDVLRVNLRDHGDSHHLNPEIFNSTRSPEVASAIQGFVDSSNYDSRHLAGFSLGGSFALRIAADAGAELGLSSCVAISPPVDPSRVMDALNNGFFAYEQYFFRSWHASLQRKLRHFPELDYADKLAEARTLDDLNRLFIPSYTIYENLEDYFAAYALVGARLTAMPIPAHLITSRDDPIIPFEDLERIDPVANLCIETSRHGGHCGFLENLSADSWVEKRLLQILGEYA